MFVIKPAEPKDYYTIKQFYEAQGKRLELSADLGMLVAHEDGFAGLGIYTLHGDYAVLEDISLVREEDFEMSIFIGKAVLNSIDLKGINKVYSNAAPVKRTLKALGFKTVDTLNLVNQEDGTEDPPYTYFLSLEGYFSSPCNNKQ